MAKLVELVTTKREVYPGVTLEEKRKRLKQTSYEEYLFGQNSSTMGSSDHAHCTLRENTEPSAAATGDDPLNGMPERMEPWVTSSSCWKLGSESSSRVT